MTAHRAAPTTRPSAEREIPVRRLRIAPDAVGDDWIVADDPIFSHLLATLSAVFPKGEDFFVTSVRRHRDAVADQPELKEQVKGFMGQEAMHSREHHTLNARLAALGYNTVRADKTVGRICSAILRMRPKRLAIAATAAAEHYTGLLAETALDHEPTRRILFGQEAIEPLICWHALEELEHKNVAFDVMVASGGGYPVTVAGFFVTTSALAGYIGVEWGRSVFEDRHRITAAHVQQFLRNFSGQRLLSLHFLFGALEYLRPGFHPDDTDTDALVEQWRIELADIAGPGKQAKTGTA